eukprot:scaffold41332_cov32-Prasinocladus_malaysianus.AAC.1
MQRLKLPLWVPLEETTTPESMQVWFRQTLAGRRCLLIVDNCGGGSELEAFRDTGLVLLVTTRDTGLAEVLGAQQCHIPLVFGDLAPKILSAAAGRCLVQTPLVFNRLIVCLAGWLIVGSVEWLVDLLVYGQAGWLIG